MDVSNSTDRAEVYACVVRSICALNEDPGIAAALTEDTSLIDDLGMQSLELVVLTSDVIRAFGPVPFQELFDAMAATPPDERQLTIRGIIDFTIGHLGPSDRPAVGTSGATGGRVD